MKRLTLILVLVLTANAEQLAELSGGAGEGSSVLLVSSGAAVGAPSANNGQGAVYLYAIGNGWQDMKQPSETLTAPDGAPGDGFGTAIVTAGSQLLIGAPGHNGGAGAIYVYVKLQLTQEIELQWGAIGLGASLSTSLTSPNVFVSGGPDDAAVGGVVVIWEYVGGAWTVLGSVGNPLGRFNSGQFGGTVALSQGVLSLYGQPYAAASDSQGYVYTMEYNGGATGYGTDGRLKGIAPDFGTAISFQQASNYLFVGEPSTGTVYVFETGLQEGHPVWQHAHLQAMLTDSTLQAGSGFGSSISVSGKNMLIGAPGAGVVDLYTEPTGNWGNMTVPTKAYAGPGATFGQTVAWQLGKIPSQFIVGDVAASAAFVEGR
jgi:hypothetical protein